MEDYAGCTRIEITLADDGSFIVLSRFRIAHEIRAAIAELEATKPTSSGSLMLTAADSDQIRKVLQLDRLLDRRITAEPAD